MGGVMAEQHSEPQRVLSWSVPLPPRPPRPPRVPRPARAVRGTTLRSWLAVDSAGSAASWGRRLSREKLTDLSRRALAAAARRFESRTPCAAALTSANLSTSIIKRRSRSLSGLSESGQFIGMPVYLALLLTMPCSSWRKVPHSSIMRLYGSRFTSAYFSFTVLLRMLCRSIPWTSSQMARSNERAHARGNCGCCSLRSSSHFLHFGFFKPASILSPRTGTGPNASCQPPWSSP